MDGDLWSNRSPYQQRANTSLADALTMSVDTYILSFFATCLVVAHLASMRLLTRCEAQLSALGGGVEVQGASLAQKGEFIVDAISEVNRIGADLADLLEALVDGFPAQSAPASVGVPSVQDTITSLIVQRLMGGNDASQTEQQRAIYLEQENETPNNDQQQNVE